MKKILAIVLALVLALGLLTACGASSSSSQAPAEESSSASTPASEPAEESVSGVVNVSGSTSMESVVLALGEAFKEMYPDVTVNYSGTGSGAGVEAAQTGTSDIGLSSRELKEEETAAGGGVDEQAPSGRVEPDSPDVRAVDVGASAGALLIEREGLIPIQSCHYLLLL